MLRFNTMKPYDPSRKSHETCQYGCCTKVKSGKKPAVRRRQKKAARRDGLKETGT